MEGREGGGKGEPRGRREGGKEGGRKGRREGGRKVRNVNRLAF
jgi:hypothetical protein